MERGIGSGAEFVPEAQNCLTSVDGFMEVLTGRTTL